MGELKRLSGKEVCKILSKFNFEEVRRKGSHVVMQRKGLEGTVTVPVPDHKELRIGTLKAIIRQSGLQKKEFEL